MQKASARRGLHDGSHDWAHQLPTSHPSFPGRAQIRASQCAACVLGGDSELSKSGQPTNESKSQPSLETSLPKSLAPGQPGQSGLGTHGTSVFDWAAIFPGKSRLLGSPSSWQNWCQPHDAIRLLGVEELVLLSDPFTPSDMFA